MRILFATAELAPRVKVGGLADFSAGLVGALRSKGLDVEIVLPDYGELPFEAADQQELSTPDWATPASVRQGTLGGVELSLVAVPGMARPHPHTDADGKGWPDNAERFLAFSMAVAAWAKVTSPDVIHLNDWHTGATLGFLDDPPPSVLTIHNLAYQGTMSADWLESFIRRPDAYDRVISEGDLEAAVARVRKDLIFTTHTPVQAGIDILSRETLGAYLDLWAQRWHVKPDELWRLGSDPSDDDTFNMAVFCLRISNAANGVSELHGEVSRRLFSDLEEGSRIGHVTNGVHARTWTADAAQAVFDEVLGAGWADGLTESWKLVDDIGDDRLIEMRRQGSLRLSELVSSSGVTLDPDALIVGFARRFAPYKRANLLLKQYDGLVEMLTGDDRPVHFLFAGKAHPSNELAKGLLSQIVDFSESADANSRFSFIPDYDMRIASHLVQGCDIWLNNPIYPREASGTSGEKVALNGGLNCSILDGWWAEMFDGENGWAIAASDAADPETRDSIDSAAVIDALVAARDEYYESPDAFNRRIRHAWKTLGPQVTGARMLRDYEALLYEPTRRNRGADG